MSRIMQLMFVAVCATSIFMSGRSLYLALELEHERSALQQMTEQRDEYQREATEAASQLHEAERRRRLAEADIKALQEELAEQAEDYQALRQRIQRSPASDDGAVAPVLRSTLEALP